MLQQLDAPVELISFARIQLRGALIFASGRERVPLLLVFIGERMVRVRAQRRSLFRQAFGGMVDRIGAVAAALGWIGNARYDERRLVKKLCLRRGAEREIELFRLAGGQRKWSGIGFARFAVAGIERVIARLKIPETIASRGVRHGGESLAACSDLHPDIGNRLSLRISDEPLEVGGVECAGGQNTRDDKPVTHNHNRASRSMTRSK